MKHLKRIRKTLFITFFVVPTIFIQAQSDTTYTGSITVTTQAEVDTLSTTLAGKTMIDGNVTIGYTDFGDSRSSITNLTPLSSIVRITGNVWIQQNGQLDNTNALNNLQTIGGYFDVGSNDQLTSLGDFPVLDSIGENFRVFNNDQLTTLGDFSALQTIGGYFDVGSNDKLTSLGDFPVLQTIGGNFDVGSNDKLTSLGDFPALQSIGGYFDVGSNDQLTSLGDFPVLDSIGENFRVFNNDQLTSLGDFPALQSIGGYFDVLFNDKLFSIGSFPNLTSVGIGRVYVPSLGETTDSVSIVVESNSNLVLCSWLENFLPTGSNAVTGGIYVQNNATGCETSEEIKNPPPVLVVENHLFTYKDSTTTSFNIYANVRWQLVTSDDATWITSLSSDSSTHTSRITGENEATITLMHTRAPNETPRSTTLTLTAINEDGDELMNLATVTINFTQLSTFYEGDITLSSQAEVNEFISNTAAILGNLTIGYTLLRDSLSSSNIADLTPLSNITHITGNLRIRQNGLLVNLTGLDSLQTIGGYFSVEEGNDTLTSLGNFPELQSIGGYFSVNNNAKLTTLGDFPNLQTIGEYFSVFLNADLTTLGDFSALQSIGGYFSVNNNAKLTTLGDFPNLQTIGEYFSVFLNADLTTLGDFSALQSIGGYFGVVFNSELIILGDFPALDSIGEYFRVSSNDKLTTIGDFPVLQSIGGYFSVSFDDQLTTLGDFPALDSIGEYFRVSSNDKLTTIGDFPVLQSIGGYFSVSFDDQLTTLGDFPALDSIGEYFRVSSNDKLTTIGDFPVLQSIGGYFSVSFDDQLTTLGDFPALQTIGGYFSVFNNDQLATLGNLPELQFIGGYFDVIFNDKLLSLGSFPNLTSIGISTFSVYVPSLDESRDSVSIVVESNSNLVLCSWLESFLPDGNHAVTGDIYIQDNAMGCATTEEIKNPPPVLVAKNPIFAHKDSTTTSFNIYANVRWQLATSDDATWITSLSSGSSTHSSRITGENEATITLMHTRAPNETPRSTTFTLTPINEEGEELTNPATMTIHFTQLSTFYEGDIILSSQAEVDEFISNTTVIDGNLTIGYADFGSTRSDITDLTPLSNINQITGYVWIRQNGQLDNINALNNLQTIGGYFSMNSNDTLTTLGDFSALQTIGGYFFVGLSDQLTDLGDFPALQSIGGFFRVQNNDQLTTIGDFPALQTIGQSFQIFANDTLTTIGDFPGLQSIGEFFVVRDHNQLSTLGDFPELQSIGGYFRVIRNDTLTSLGNFPNLTSIGISTFDVYVPSLDEVRDSVSIMVENNPRLSDCCLLASFLEQGNNRVEGKTFITNNATGCDRDTIQNTCHTLIVTTNKNHQIAYDSTNSIPISFMVGGSATGWTTAITYTPADASFITLSPTEGTEITTAITLMATPTENTGVERTAMITLTTTGIMGTPATQTIVITQQSPPTIMLSTSNQTIAHNSTDPIGISFMVGGSATGWKSAITYTPANANFITLDTNMNDNQTGAITLMATPTENTGVERTATITLTTTGMGAPVSVSLTITQEVRAALSTHTKESIFIFYPNPTKGKLTVEGVTGYLQMYVHDLVGREVMTYSLTPSKKTIDVSNLLSGMYVVTVQGENKTWTEVLIIDN